MKDFNYREDRVVKKEESFQKSSLKIQDDYERKQSILLKISLLYLLVIAFVLAIFLVASGSNQMNLISEKAIKTTDAKAYEIFRRLEFLFKNNQWSFKPNSQKNKRSVRRVKKVLRIFKGSERLIIPNFKIISTKGDILAQYQFTKNKNKKQGLGQGGKKNKFFENNPNSDESLKVSSSFLKRLKRAAQSQKIKGTLFLGIPNIEEYYVEVILPMIEDKNQSGESILFYTKISIDSIEKEVSSIMRLAYSLISLVFLSQFGLVYFLYRVLLIPIKRLAKGAHNITEGDLSFQVPQIKQSDELGQLTYLFNKMVFALSERTEKLNLLIVKLRKQHEIMQNELDMARNIQEGIMPSSAVYEKINFSVYYSPLEKVSGDYYDFFVLPNGSLGMLMTDVSGHGIPAALVTIMAKVHFSDSVGRFEKPGDLLEYINGRLSEAIVTSDYMTAFYLILDNDLKLHYSNASHQKAIIYRPKTEKVLELDSGGFFIGAVEKSPFKYENAMIQMQPKDRIILYTDGIVEGTNSKKEEYTPERFIEKIKEFAHLDVKTFNEKIIADVDVFAEGEPRRDDYTLLVIELK